MKPFDEDWQEDSGRNYNAEGGEETQSTRKSFKAKLQNSHRMGIIQVIVHSVLETMTTTKMATIVVATTTIEVVTVVVVITMAVAMVTMVVMTEILAASSITPLNLKLTLMM